MKTINILIGPKGSGKTYIGQMLQNRLGISFLRVEDICLRIKAGRQVTDSKYIAETFQEIEKEVRKQLKTKDALTIESTASVKEFDTMLINFKKDFIVRLIKIHTSPALCLERVVNRDKSNHIDVSDDMAAEINKLSLQKSYDYDLIIDNDFTTDEIILESWKK